MTKEEFTELCQALPFRRFVLNLPDGRSVAVVHRDYVKLRGGCRVIHVTKPDMTLNVVDMLLVEEIEVAYEGSNEKLEG
jgi:hypothetical protein